MFYLHEQLWNYIKWGKTRGLFVQMTGLSGAGKTTLAQALAEKLRKQGYKIEIIDGDEYREGICKDLGFSKQDRCTNIRRLGFVGKVLARNNVIAIMSAINPYDEVRNELTSMGEFVRTVHVKCDIETLKKRDTKGLYARALLPDGDPNKVHNFTGISDPFEEPTSADLTIETNKEEMEASLKKLHEFVLREAGSK
jgi:adenylylsulfate kinase